MVNPIYQQGEELLLNQFGSKYLGVAAHTNVNSNEFIVQEDAVISVLTGGDSSIAANNVDYKASMSLSGVTLKQGALIVAPQGESFQSITIDSGTIMAYNSVVGGTKPSAVPLLLDSYPDAAAAYSLRKLRTDYTGAAIEVRKTVAGTTSTQDIGFVNGELDTVLLLTFAGGEDVFVTTWYDQSGAGNSIAQSNASFQPQIVLSGSLITKGGLVALDFNGVNHKLVTGLDVLNATSVSHFTVSSCDNTETIGAVLCQSNTTIETIRIFNDSRTASNRNMAVISSGIGYFADLSIPRVSTNQRLLSSFVDSSKNMSGFDNGATGGTDTYIGTVTNTTGLTIGAQFNVNFLGGKIQEIIAYNTDQSANRSAIEDNINNHYTIY